MSAWVCRQRLVTQERLVLAQKEQERLQKQHQQQWLLQQQQLYQQQQQQPGQGPFTPAQGSAPHTGVNALQQPPGAFRLLCKSA